MTYSITLPVTTWTRLVRREIGYDPTNDRDKSLQFYKDKENWIKKQGIGLYENVAYTNCEFVITINFVSIDRLIEFKLRYL